MNLELEKRSRRKRRRRFDENAASADVVRVVVNELVNRCALVSNVETDGLGALVFTRILVHFFAPRHHARGIFYILNRADKKTSSLGVFSLYAMRNGQGRPSETGSSIARG